MRTRRELVNTGEPIAVYIGRCYACNAPARWEVPEELRITNPNVIPGSIGYAWLPMCEVMPWCDCQAPAQPRSYIKFKPLTATYRETVRCSGVCRNATSTACECECRGANHGRRYLPQEG